MIGSQKKQFIRSLLGDLRNRLIKKEDKISLNDLLTEKNTEEVESLLIEKAKTKRNEDLRNLAHFYLLTGEPSKARQLLTDNGLHDYSIYIKADILEGIPVSETLDQKLQSNQKVTKKEAVIFARGVKIKEDKEKLKKILLNDGALSEEYSIWKLRAIGEASRRIGDYKDALQAYRRAFKLSDQKDINVLTKGKTGLKGNANKKFNQKKAWNALRDFMDLAEQGWFLDAGTLLGFIREGEFLEHDEDLDIGFIDKEAFLATKYRMFRSPFFELKPGRVEEVYKVRHLNGIDLDFFLYKREGEKLVKESHVYRWVFEEFDYRERQFGPIKLPVPEEAEKHLEETYGDWWVCRKNFDGRYDALNVSFPNLDELECVVLNKAVKALQRSDYDSAKKEINMLKRIGRDHYD